MNPKQQHFVDAYLRTGNATESAKQAGYSPPTAHSIGSRLLKHVEVVQALNAAQDKSRTSAILSREGALSLLSNIAAKDKNTFARVKAIDMIARMENWLAPEKHEVDIPADFNQVKEKFERLVEYRARILIAKQAAEQTLAPVPAGSPAHNPQGTPNQPPPMQWVPTERPKARIARAQ